MSDPLLKLVLSLKLQRFKGDRKILCTELSLSIVAKNFSRFTVFFLFFFFAFYCPRTDVISSLSCLFLAPASLQILERQ